MVAVRKKHSVLHGCIAEMGFTTGAIDLRGHGEHHLDLDENILQDHETAVLYFKTLDR